MIDVVQYRFRIGTYQVKGAKGRGPGRIHFSGQFDDSSMFNPYNRSESILFYTLDTTYGVWMANILHSPIKHINLFSLRLKAELLNFYFYEQFSGPSNYNTHISWPNDQTFDIDFNRNRVRKILSSVNSNKASGPDGIHGKILKNCSESLAYPLSLIFKNSYNTASLPREWKLANVVPIHKKGSKDDIKNYRHISLNCLVIKLFEKILKEELLLRTSHLLDSRKHGFLSLKSCSTNMVILLITWSMVMSINDIQTLSTDVVYFDFSKAFDSVNHNLILD